ncbi:MAG: ATP-binding protein [Salinisphaeraceae bacterium]|nr:ATP-binding protein [Salinisphaeraceae bacterium]
MQDFEKLASFYLGRDYELSSGQLGQQSLLYDAKDLTTHAVIIGMTGSGKTGLGVSLIEEAAIDQIPVIAIDPKGDLGNLMLSFPDLSAADFEPWVDAQQAATQGRTAADFARAQSELWRKGLAQWGQDGERIRRMRQNAAFNIFPPGSTAGTPVSVLSSFAAPPATIIADTEAMAEKVQSAATSILTLLGMDADPLTSREHILIANILDHSWRAGQDLDLASLIAAIQNPPVKKIGVMDLDAIYPGKDRFALAMRLNNVLASPGFAAWLEGVPLDGQGLFYTADGRPRVSIMSIAHLNDAERMFFVTMLLAEIISWMRAQPGTSSLRAVLYMDELFGYMPPTANPPSKALFLTLLKQARAFGLGLVLSTQNPVDLDYKGLSNTGTWFIGRLQTERDKMRVLDGLEGAATRGEFDKAAMEQTLAGLGKRVFLLHNVHESRPAIFHTRWALSYLPGPLTRDQIRLLSADQPALPDAAPRRTQPAGPAAESVDQASPRPTLPPGIDEYFLPAKAGPDVAITYFPRVMAIARVAYESKTHAVSERCEQFWTVEATDGAVALDWRHAERLSYPAEQLARRPVAQAAFASGAACTREPGRYADWSKQFQKWLRTEQPLTLWRHRPTKLTSAANEDQGAFLVRARQAAREARDLEIGKLRAAYEKKTEQLQSRISKAESALDRETAQARQKKLDTAISFGSALLGSFLGRKRISRTTVNRLGTAARRAGVARKEAADVDRVEAELNELEASLAALGPAFEADVAALPAIALEPGDLETVEVRARSSDISLMLTGLLWLPCYRDAAGYWVSAA